MNNLITVKVPNDSTDYYINKIGCLRYSHNKGRQSSCVEPIEIGEYLEENKHQIIGTSILDGQKIVVIEAITEA